jgi:hypothetical protein
VIVGAGASSECALPTGAELKSRIASLLDIRFPDGYRLVGGDEDIVDAMRLHKQRTEQKQSIKDLQGVAWRIRDAMPQAISIDNFIDAHQGDAKLELCGKLAIAKAILDGERDSLLYVDPKGRERQPKYDALADSWFTSFMQLLTENCRLENLRDRLSRITFIVFNYDRCVEHFLFLGLQNYYGINESAAAELLSSLRVFHPYGTVGALPWAKGTTNIGFGGTPTADQLLTLAAQIKTFTEGTDPNSSDIQALREAISDATVVLFLGFAYHKMNLQLLKADRPHADSSQVRYFGTAKGMSKSDVELVKTDLTSLASVAHDAVILRNDLTCGTFFREYWRSLSLG